MFQYSLGRRKLCFRLRRVVIITDNQGKLHLIHKKLFLDSCHHVSMLSQASKALLSLMPWGYYNVSIEKKQPGGLPFLLPTRQSRSHICSFHPLNLKSKNSVKQLVCLKEYANFRYGIPLRKIRDLLWFWVLQSDKTSHTAKRTHILKRR